MQNIDLFEQIKNDATGVGVVGIYNLIRKQLGNYIPDVLPAKYKKLLISVGAYLIVVYKGASFIPNAGFDAVRITALKNALADLSTTFPGLNLGSYSYLLEGTGTTLEGDIQMIEDVERQGGFSIEGDVYSIDSGNNNSNNSNDVKYIKHL